MTHLARVKILNFVMSSEKKSHIPHYAKFIIAGLAGCGAALPCHPIDVVKNRMQLSGEGGKKREHRTSLHAVKNIVEKEGLLGLYAGFSANIARQLVYTTTRLGTYQTVVEKLKEKGVDGLFGQVVSSLTAGLVASIVATPTDVALMRMTADGRLPAAERRNYKHAVDAIVRMGREEGVAALWAGLTPSVLRAMLGNLTQIVSYVQAKHYLLENGYMDDNALCHFVSSLISGFIYAYATTPLDVAKTRMQTMKIVNGVPEYKGLMDVWLRTVQREGFTALWKGFGPYYFKIAPNTVFLFIFTEKLTYWYKKYIIGDPDAKGGL